MPPAAVNITKKRHPRGAHTCTQGVHIMKLAFSTLACPDWTWDRVLSEAARLGYDGIEIRGVNGEMYLPRVTPFLDENLEETKQRLKELGLEICCLGTSVVFHDPRLHESALAEGRASIDLAQKLGVPYIRVFGDKVPDPARRQETIEAVTRGLGELASYADGTGVTVVQETHGDFTSSAMILEVLERSKGSAKGILWDINHPYKFAGEQMEKTYSLLAPYIKHVHVKDSRGEGARAVPCLMGQGDLPVKEAVDLLSQGRYSGWLSFEYEKKWHPQIEEPEIALPGYVEYMRSIL